MKRIFTSLILSLSIFATSCSSSSDDVVARGFDAITSQMSVAFEAIDSVRTELTANGKLQSGINEQFIPRSIEANGDFLLVGAADWTCGFFPGVLWYAYEYTHDEKWADAAKKYQAQIEDAKYLTNTHDLGFMIYCSFGNGYRLTGDEKFRETVITASDSLMTRYNPQIGLIRSWDFNADIWNYPVIIDNMMNLEMLCKATEFTGDDKYKEAAISHADKTLANHFREDYSCFHVVDYDSNGNARLHQTYQGYSDSSAWARGQGWALYGYTMMYRFTGLERYLEHANKVANYILSHERLPQDKVPYWDFDAPNIPNELRDVSAGALIASALYELGGYNAERGAEYYAVADTILATINNRFLSKEGSNYGFVTFESVGSIPGGFEIGVPINYADYYYAEALMRKHRLDNGEKVID